MQLGVSALLELDCLAGLDGKQGASLLGLRDREAGSALLDFEADLRWNLLQGILNAMSRVEIRPRDEQYGCNRGASKPAAQTG